MLRSVRDRLTYSNVMATTAVFVALGGTSYAVASLPRNSVGTNQIRNEGVRSSDLRDRGIAVRDISVAAREFLEGQRGPAGERGPAGPKGDKGDPGITTVINQGTGTEVKFPLFYKSAAGSVTGAQETNSAVASCDATQRVVAGGVRVDTGAGASMSESYPSGNNTSWTGVVSKDVNNATFTVFAICTS